MNIDKISKLILLFILLTANKDTCPHQKYPSLCSGMLDFSLKQKTNTEAQSWTLDGSTRQIHHGVFILGSMLELTKPSSQPKRNKIDNTRMNLNSQLLSLFIGLMDLILLFSLKTNNKYHEPIPWENTTVIPWIDFVHFDWIKERNITNPPAQRFLVVKRSTYIHIRSICTLIPGSHTT